MPSNREGINYNQLRSMVGYRSQFGAGESRNLKIVRSRIMVFESMEDLSAGVTARVVGHDSGVKYCDDTSVYGGLGYVAFSSPEEAQKAYKKITGHIYTDPYATLPLE